MTGAEVVGALGGEPDGLLRFDAGRDLRAVIDLLELGFGNELDARDRRWLSDLEALAGTGPLFRLLTKLMPPSQYGFSGFVWYVHGRLVGNVSLMRHTHRTWTIANVVTHPDYRRQGIARALMDRALRAVRERGGRRVQLQVREDNAPAQAMYRAMGFHRTSATSMLRVGSVVGTQRLAEHAAGLQLVRWDDRSTDTVRRVLARAGELDRPRPWRLVRETLAGRSLGTRIRDWARGSRQERWALERPNGEYAAVALAVRQTHFGPHELEIITDPAWRGKVEPALVDTALVALARGGDFGVEAELNADERGARAALVRAGFREVRTLDRLVLQLEPQPGAPPR